MQYRRREDFTAGRYHPDQRRVGTNDLRSLQHPISPFLPHHHELRPTRPLERQRTMPSTNRQPSVPRSHPSTNPTIYRNQHFPAPSHPPRSTPQPYYTIEKNFRSPASRIHARQDTHIDTSPNSQRVRMNNPFPVSAVRNAQRPNEENLDMERRMAGGGWVGYESQEISEVRRASEDSGFGESKSVETHGSPAAVVGWTDGIRKAVWGDDEQSRGSEFTSLLCR